MVKYKKYRLTHRGAPACTVELMIKPQDIEVIHAKVIDYNLLPPEVREGIEKYGATTETAVYAWMHGRIPPLKTDPYSRDTEIMEILGLDWSAGNNGRLTGLENVIMLLKHYRTDNDDYALEPAEPVTIYFPYYIGWRKIFVDAPEEG